MSLVPRALPFSAPTRWLSMVVAGDSVVVSAIMFGVERDPVKTTEPLLPESVRRRASVSAGGEHAWRQHDVEEVLQEARTAGLACLGGQVQFQTREGIAEAYWLNFDPQPQREHETWSDYVSRSSGEALEGFRRLSRDTDFRSVAREWEFIATKMEREAYDPVGDLWFVLYFVAETTAGSL